MEAPDERHRHGEIIDRAREVQGMKVRDGDIVGAIVVVGELCGVARQVTSPRFVEAGLVAGGDVTCKEAVWWILGVC